MTTTRDSLQLGHERRHVFRDESIFQDSFSHIGEGPTSIILSFLNTGKRFAISQVSRHFTKCIQQSFARQDLENSSARRIFITTSTKSCLSTKSFRASSLTENFANIIETDTFPKFTGSSKIVVHVIPPPRHPFFVAPLFRPRSASQRPERIEISPETTEFLKHVQVIPATEICTMYCSSSVEAVYHEETLYTGDCKWLRRREYPRLKCIGDGLFLWQMIRGAPDCFLAQLIVVNTPLPGLTWTVFDVRNCPRAVSWWVVLLADAALEKCLKF